MNYDSKLYLYFKLAEEINGDEEYKQQKAERIVNILGNISVKPGRLKTIENNEGKEKLIHGEDLLTENNNHFILELDINQYGTIFTLGTINSKFVNISMYIDTDNPNQSTMNMMLVDDKEKGMYFFASNMIYYGERGIAYAPAIFYYDRLTIDTLLGSGKSLTDLAKLTPSELVKLGIKPDKFNIIDFKDLEFKNAEEMAKDIYTNKNINVTMLEDIFDKANQDNDKTTKHLEMSKSIKNPYKV